MDVLARGQRPSDIITREAFENAIAAIATSGGSTNGVLHLMALAREAGVPLELDDFDRIASATPTTCDLKPGGSYVATDLYDAGGVPLVAKRLKELGLLHEDAQHGDRPDDRRGRRRAPRRRTARRSCCPPTSRSSRPAAWPSCAATSPPRARVVKLSGHERRYHQGPARVFDARRTRWTRSPRGRSTRATSS